MESCTVTVQRDGGSTSGPLSRFLVFNDVCFRAIAAHVRRCDKCDLDAVIGAYLERVRTVKSLGETLGVTATRGVISILNAAAKSGRRPSKELTEDLILRSRCVKTLRSESGSWGVRTIERCLRHHRDRSPDVHGDLLKDRRFQIVARGIDTGCVPTDSELQDYIAVEGVMES
ncbi:MAG: hypothetical protein BWY99_00372 [Synergistetes bacterium ADurb.BinA166]|nr:MAG: hypothetical protein BWY99_00372 [Synergistetes bacterium ADurb.BinA166]